MGSAGYLWMAAKRSSVVRGLLGVMPSSPPSSFAKSEAPAEGAAVPGSPAVEKRADTGFSSGLNFCP